MLAISLIEARAAILSSIIVIVYFLPSLYLILKELCRYNRAYQYRVNYFTLYPGFIANILISNTSKKDTITSTVGRIAFTEESSNGRFLYWRDAWDYVMKNPILVVDLEIEIVSIGEGKEHISGYTVPYHAHNDFIHVFTGAGIPGGLVYIGIFATLIIYLFILLYRKYKTEIQNCNIFSCYCL